MWKWNLDWWHNVSIKFKQIIVAQICLNFEWCQFAFIWSMHGYRTNLIIILSSTKNIKSFIIFTVLGCHDQESNLGSGSNDSSPEVTNHYPEMTECGHNLNYGFIPWPMDKSVIISYQIYMNLLINASIINFNETKRKEEETKIKRKRKKNQELIRLSYQVHRQRFSQKFSWLVSFWSGIIILI